MDLTSARGEMTKETRARRIGLRLWWLVLSLIGVFLLPFVSACFVGLFEVSAKDPAFWLKSIALQHVLPSGLVGAILGAFAAIPAGPRALTAALVPSTALCVFYLVLQLVAFPSPWSTVAFFAMFALTWIPLIGSAALVGVAMGRIKRN